MKACYGERIERFRTFGTTSEVSYPDGGPTGSNPTPPSTTYTFSYVEGVLMGETQQIGSGTTSSISVPRDPNSLVALSYQDLDGHTTTNTQVEDNQAGTNPPSANITKSTDALGNVTLAAYTSTNQVYCEIAPDEVAAGKTCPSTPPALSAFSSGDPDLGSTITVYNGVGQVIATIDPLGHKSLTSYTTSGGSVPPDLPYCTVDAAQTANGVTCPAYGAAHVTGTVTTTYDSQGRVVATTDALGNTTTMAYTNSALPDAVTQTTGPSGSVTTSTYNAAGQVTKQVVSYRGYQATTLTSVDADGRTYCSVAPAQAALGVTCPSTPPTTPPTPSAHPTSTTDPYLGATINTYNSIGQLVQTTSPIGGITYNAYDTAGNQFCTVGPTAAAAGTRCPTSAPSSPPTATSDPYLGATIDSFDADGHQIQETNPLGGVTTYTYDADGNKISQTVTSSNATADPPSTTTYTYNADGEQTASTVAPGTSVASTTQTAYDPSGNTYCTVSAAAAAAGASTYQCPTWQASWVNSPPTPASLYSSTPTAAQANNVSTSFDNADGQTVQQTTDSGGSTAPDLGTTTTAFDADGRSVCSISATNFTTWSAANPSATYPYACPTTPATSPPAAGSDPGYSTTIYDADGHTLSSTDPEGNTTTTTYGPDGEALVETAPGDEVTTNCYFYETSGCASSAPSTGGNASSLYSTSLPGSTAGSSGATTTYTYNQGGAANTTTTVSGTTTDTYDQSGDLLTETNTPATGVTQTPNVTNTYNVDGSKATMVDGNGTTTYGYDVMGDQTGDQFTPNTSSSIAASNVTHTYYDTGATDVTGYPSTTSAPNPSVTDAYDAAGNLASVTDWLSHTTTVSSTPSATTTNYGNATTVTDSLDLNGQATSIKDAPTAAPSSPSLSMTYQRNSADQVSSESDTGAIANSFTYTYDSNDRLASVNTTSTSYDASSDPTTLGNGTTQSFNGEGQVTTSTASGTTTTETYNSSGDRTKAQQSGGSTTTASYDQNNQLSNLTSTPPINTAQLSAGNDQTVALSSNGTVWAWGNNTFGQLGNGTNTSSSTPVEVKNLTNVIAVSAGTEVSAALESNGTVWTWGYNGVGELGNGTTTNSNVPVEVTGLTGVTAISAGYFTMEALKSDGTVWSWGGGGQGALGNGGTSNSSVPKQASMISGVTAIADSSSGQTESALESNGTVWTWGYNGYGQLGIGNTTQKNSPVEVAGLPTIKAISLGGDHLMALGSNGSVWDWGYNVDGQLGNGNTTQEDSPVQVSGVTATAISAGVLTSFALQSNGTALAWGENGNGELDNGNSTNADTPVTMSGITTAVTLSGGGTHAALLDAAGAIQEVGGNASGQLGNGTTTDSHTPVDVAGWDTTAKAVSAGNDQTMTLRSDGTVWDWGNNLFGQLGNGTNLGSSVPVEVKGLSNVVAVSAGSEMSAALESNGTVWTWGYNNVGQLGNGTTTSSNVPVEVSGLTGVTAISAGYSTMEALESNGTVWSWGSGSQGALGNGSTSNSTVPKQASPVSGVIAISDSSSDQSESALESNGTVWTWGHNQYGELGTGNTTQKNSPVQVSGLPTVKSLSMGGGHLMALGSNGSVWDWGYNVDGQLGNGNTTQEDSPLQVSSVTATAISAGVVASYALQSGGTALAWGENGNGELDNGNTTNSSTPVTMSGVTAAATLSGGGVHVAILTAAATIEDVGGNASGQLGNGTTTDSHTPVTVAAWNVQAASTPATSYSYTYDGNGVRVGTTTSSGTQTFSWDTSSGSPEILSDGTNSYIYGTNGQVIEQISATGTPYYFVQDQLGSTRALTNQAGSVVATYTYNADGVVTSQTGTATTPIGYAGGYTDPSGLEYLLHRYYDPMTGDFLTVDPDVAETGQPYYYASDNPVNTTDPSGKCSGLECIRLNTQGIGISAPCTGSSQNSAETADGLTVADSSRHPGLSFEKEQLPNDSINGLATAGQCPSDDETYSSCVWVATQVVQIWSNRAAEGLTNAEAFAAGFAFVCADVWPYPDLGTCSSNLVDNDITQASAELNDIDVSPFDNSINYLMSNVRQARVPQALTCLVGTFGPDALGYPGGSLEDAADAVAEVAESDLVHDEIKASDDAEKVKDAKSCL